MELRPIYPTAIGLDVHQRQVTACAKEPVLAAEGMPALTCDWALPRGQGGYFKGSGACLSALFAAGRYEELLTLIDKVPFKWWHDRRWGVQALAAMGKTAEAVPLRRGIARPQ